MALTIKWLIANKKDPIQSIEEQLRTQQTTWDQTMGDTIMAEVNLRFEISFNQEIFHVIKEAEFMELLGFSLPVEIRQAALQKDRVFRDNQQVIQMLKEYNDLLQTLSLPEVIKTSATMRSSATYGSQVYETLPFHLISIFVFH